MKAPIEFPRSRVKAWTVLLTGVFLAAVGLLLAFVIPRQWIERDMGVGIGTCTTVYGVLSLLVSGGSWDGVPQTETTMPVSWRSLGSIAPVIGTGPRSVCTIVCGAGPTPREPTVPVRHAAARNRRAAAIAS